MKTTIRFFGFIVMVIMVFTFIACDNNDDPDNDSNKSPGATVAAPTLDSKTYNSITINVVPPPGNGQTVEYAINNNTAASNSGWKDGLTFTGLLAETTYYIFARSKANNIYNTGVPSEALQVTTDPISSNSNMT